MEINKAATFKPDCIPTPVDASVSPSLPSGLFIDTDGTIKGTPTVAVSGKEFSITLTGPNSLTSVITVTITVISAVESCTYGVSDRISIPVNAYTTIQGPKCNPAATSFSLTRNNLPAGMYLDEKTGAIHGTPTAVTNAITVVVQAKNEAGSIPVNVQIIVVPLTSLPSGVMARISRSGYYIPPEGYYPPSYEPFLYDFDNGNMDPLTSYYFTELNFECTRNLDCPTAFQKYYYFTKYEGIIHAPVTGTYSFRFKVDDMAWVFFDNNFTQPAFETTYTTGKVARIPLTKGDHAFTALHYDYTTPVMFYVEWQLFSAGILDYIVVGGDFISGPQQPVQFLEYPSSDYIFRIYDDVIISPTFEGSPTSWYIDPELPNGLTFNNGAITGNPTVVSPSTAYVITAENGVSRTKATIYITTVALEIANLKPGVQAQYYSCDSVDCGNGACNNPTIVGERIVAAPYFSRSSQPFSQILNKYNTNVYVRYTGYINIPSSGTYGFSINTIDAARMEFTAANVLEVISFNAYGSCDDTTEHVGRTSIQTTAGPRAFRLWYYKSNSHSIKQIELYWSGGPELITRSLIPESEFYYLPTSSLSYKESVAVYMSNKQINDNEPVIFMSSKTFRSFSVSPSLPAGINLNPTTGIISGFATVESTYRTTYTITATSTDRSSVLTTTIDLEIVKEVSPVQISYTNTRVEGRIGTPITPLTPTQVAGVSYYINDDLPLGLTIDSETGAISGTPLQSCNNVVVTVNGLSDGGITQTTISITISSCEAGYAFIYLEFTTGSTGVSVTLSDISETDVHRWNSLTAFSTTTWYGCMVDTSLQFIVTGKSYQSGGDYLIRGEGTKVIRQGKWRLEDALLNPDTEDVVNFIFQISPNTPPAISFDGGSNSFTITRGIDVYIAPIISYSADECTITPELPTSLSFDTKSGVISGISDYLFTGQSYVLQCSGAGGSDSETITIDSISCNGGTVPAYATVVAGTNSQNIRFRLYQGLTTPTSRSDYLLYYDGLLSGVSHRQTFCVAQDNYTLVVDQSSSGAWTYSTYSFGLTEGVTYQSGSKTGVFAVSLTYTKSVNDPWGYSSQTQNNWNNNFVEGGWTEYYPGGYPERGSTITTYYRTTFTVPDGLDLNTISTFEAAFKYDGGIIAYLNSNQFYKKNLPDNVQSSTYATDAYSGSDVILRGTGTTAEYIKAGINYVAVELHRGRNSAAADPFSAYFNYIISECSRRSSTLMQITNSLGADYVYPAEPLAHIVDNDVTTKTFIRCRCQPVDVILMFPTGKSEFFNKYSITNGNYGAMRDLFAWDLYVTEDLGATWQLVDSKKDVVWRDPTNTDDDTNWQTSGSRRLTYEYYLYGMTKSYDGVKLHIDQIGIPTVRDCIDSNNIGNSGVEFSEFALHACHNKLCRPEGDWSATVAGQECSIECPLGYDGHRNRRCLEVGNEARWDIEPSFSVVCALKNIRDLSVSNDTVTLYKDFEAAEYAPVFTVYGAELVYAFDPAIEVAIPGLSLNTSTGAITGVPKAEVGATTFRVTVTNPVSDELITSVTISVSTVRCPTDGNWPATEQGRYATVQCTGSTRTMTRLCTSGLNPHWETVEDHCSEETTITTKTSTAVIVLGVIAGVVVLLLIAFCVIARAKSAKKRAARRGKRTAQAQAAKAAMEQRKQEPTGTSPPEGGMASKDGES